MRAKFYQKLINSIENIESGTIKEQNDKADIIVSIAQIIGKRGGAVHWVKNKWKVTKK